MYSPASPRKILALYPSPQKSAVAQRLPQIARAAVSTSSPTIIAVREATVGPLFGTCAVSGCTILDLLAIQASASAAICAKIVFVPCPISVLPAKTRTLPSGVASSATSDARYSSPEPVNPAPCRNDANPIPFLIAPRASEFSASKLLALRVVAAQFERALHQRIHVHFLVHHLPHRHSLPLANEIPSAQFLRRKPHSLRHAIQMPLQRKNALRRAKSAKGSVRRRIRRDRAAANAHVRTAYGPAA